MADLPSPNFNPDKAYTLSGRTLNALIVASRTNRLLESDEYNIEVSANVGTRIKLRSPDEVAATVKPWSLAVETDPAGWSVVPGTVLADIDSVGTAVTLTDNVGTFTPVAGNLVWLEFDSVSPTTGTIETGSAWTGYPDPYETTGTGVDHVFTTYRHPLWRFYAADGVGDRVLLAEDLYGLQLTDTHLRVVIGTAKKSGEPKLAVPILIHSHRAVPAT